MSHPVDLRADGILWAINRALFHPRGYMLGWNPETGQFTLTGKGEEPYWFDNDVDVERFKSFESALRRAKRPGLIDISRLSEEPGTRLVCEGCSTEVVGATKEEAEAMHQACEGAAT